MANSRSRRGELTRAEDAEIDWQRRLEIDQQIVDQETHLRRIGLAHRLHAIWLLATLLLVGLLILLNLLVALYYHGDAAAFLVPLDFFGGLALLLSLFFASYQTYVKHQELVGEQGALAKLKEEKKLLLASGSVGVEATQRRYKEEILEFISDYRQESNSRVAGGSLTLRLSQIPA